MIVRSIRKALLINVLGLFFIICLISIFSTGASSQELFDSYGMISLADERAHLDNFAFSLKRDLNYLGYIIVQAPERDMRAALKRAIKARDYLVRKRKIVRQRIIIATWDRQMERVEFILQPVSPNAEVPKDWKRLR